MSNSFKFFPSLCDTFKSDHKRILQNVLNFKFVPRKGKRESNKMLFILFLDKYEIMFCLAMEVRIEGKSTSVWACLIKKNSSLS